MRKVVKLYDDENYTIGLSNDSWKAAVVQVVVKTTIQRMTDNGLVEDRGVNLAWETRVEMVKYDPQKNIIPVAAVDFRKAIVLAVQEAKNQLAKLQQVDAMFQGIANDYESQMKDVQGTSK